LIGRKKYQLDNEEWKFDNIPEIMDGKNIADYIDPEILARLEELEKEEESREETLAAEMEEDDESDLDEEQISTVKAIRERRKLVVQKYRESKGTSNHIGVPKKFDSERKNLSEFESHLVELGIDPSQVAERLRSRSASRVGRKRTRSESTAMENGEIVKKRKERSQSHSQTPARSGGFKDLKQKIKADQLAKRAQRVRNKSAKKGEGDRVILNMKPKHLYAGSRGAGKTDRR